MPFPRKASTCVQVSWGDQAAWAPLLGWAWLSRSLSPRCIASHLSDPQHFNLVSARHTRAYWIISLFLLILVFLAEIVITVIVRCAINYGNCDLFIYLILDSGVNWHYPRAAAPPTR